MAVALLNPNPSAKTANLDREQARRGIQPWLTYRWQ
jgi:hypothetical protein